MVGGHRPGQEQTPPAFHTAVRLPARLRFFPGFHGSRIGHSAPLRPAALLVNVHWSACHQASAPFHSQREFCRVDTPLSSVLPCTGFGARANTAAGNTRGPPPCRRVCAGADRRRGAAAGSQGGGTGSSPRHRPTSSAVAAPLRPTDSLCSPRRAFGDVQLWPCLWVRSGISSWL